MLITLVLAQMTFAIIITKRIRQPENLILCASGLIENLKKRFYLCYLCYVYVIMWTNIFHVLANLLSFNFNFCNLK